MASEKDIVFTTAGGTELKLDIFRPEGASKRTAIVFVHGGGWRQGSREMMWPNARAMAANGFTGVTVQYRLTPQAPWPAQIEDLKAAIRWTRANAARLDVDPDRIVLWGSSAGAHMVLLAAGTPNLAMFEGVSEPTRVSTEVSAVIAVHAPTEFYVGAADKRPGTPASALMGAAATEELARAAGPLSYVTKDFPPVLLLHGTQDKVVHHSASERMHDAMRAAHAPVDLHLFHGYPHGFAAFPSVRAMVVAEANHFLDRTLIDPAKYAAEMEQFALQRAAAQASQAAT